MSVNIKSFGVSEGVPVKQITIKPQLPEHARNGPHAEAWIKVRAVFVSYGAALQELWIPGNTESAGNRVANVQVADVVLGFDDLEGYINNAPYLGSIVGRVAGRISDAAFSIPPDLDPTVSQVHKVTQNCNNRHCLHGGLRGLSNRPWEVTEVSEDKVEFKVVSPRGEDGFPGHLTVFVKYHIVVDEDDTIYLHIDYSAAITGGICPINLTNHSYFNLCGHKSGPSALYRHAILVQADEMCETDSDLMPTGNMLAVDCVPGKDLRKPRELKESFGGFDDFYAFKKLSPSEPRVILSETHSGRVLKMYTDQNGVQFYSGNFLGAEGGLVGKDKCIYTPHSGLALEAQNYPDGVNKANFPREFITPQNPYTQKTSYAFSFR